MAKLKPYRRQKRGFQILRMLQKRDERNPSALSYILLYAYKASGSTFRFFNEYSYLENVSKPSHMHNAIKLEALGDSTIGQLDTCV